MKRSWYFFGKKRPTKWHQVTYQKMKTSNKICFQSQKNF